MERKFSRFHLFLACVPWACLVGYGLWSLLGFARITQGIKDGVAVEGVSEPYLEISSPAPSPNDDNVFANYRGVSEKAMFERLSQENITVVDASKSTQRLRPQFMASRMSNEYGGHVFLSEVLPSFESLCYSTVKVVPSGSEAGKLPLGVVFYPSCFDKIPDFEGSLMDKAYRTIYKSSSPGKLEVLREER